MSFRFAASISLSLSTPVPVTDAFASVPMRWHDFFVSDFWNDHDQWQTFSEDFQTPHSFMIQGQIFSTNKSHPRPA